jgi:hypothetical protein
MRIALAFDIGRNDQSSRRIIAGDIVDIIAFR